jgi:hypothetical protein
VRSQCHSLFNTGAFKENESGSPVNGNIFALEGKLNFIDQIEFFNRKRNKPILNPSYEPSNHGSNTRKLLSGRERTLSRFLYYKYFYGNDKPTVICEGHTDNIYLKAAINRLAVGYPKLVRPKTVAVPYELLVRFINYTGRTKFLLELAGGTDYLRKFVAEFGSHFNSYKAPVPTRPVILVLDNDDGFNSIEGVLKGTKYKPSIFPPALAANDFRKSEFIHVTNNLYIILTPLKKDGARTSIEDLFSQDVRDTKLGEKIFNKENKIDITKEYGKEFFATKVVFPKKNEIDFSGFNIILTRMVQCIEHYSQLKL